MADRHASLPRWIRVDTAMSVDPRIMRAGKAAELLYVRALMFSREHDTDGHIAREQLREISRGYGSRTLRTALGALVREELLEECDDGYRVPYQRYSKWQDTTADRAAQREADRVRKAEWRARKAGQNGVT